MTILNIEEVKRLTAKSELSKMEIKDLQDTWAVFKIELDYVTDILKRAGVVSSDTKETDNE